MTQAQETTKIQEEMYQAGFGDGLTAGAFPVRAPFAIGERVWVVEPPEKNEYMDHGKTLRVALRADNPRVWEDAYHHGMPHILGAGIVVDYGKRDPRKVIVQWNSPASAATEPTTGS